MTNTFKGLSIICVTIGFYTCNQTSKNQYESNLETPLVRVYDFKNEQEFATYSKLNLDEQCPNLLNPQISKADYNLVAESWTDLHQRMGKFLAEKNFDWGVEDSSISVVHKIYFKPNGQIDAYFFNVLNDNVTEDKRVLFSQHITNFAATNQINYETRERFAQCGKTKYMN